MERKNLLKLKNYILGVHKFFINIGFTPNSKRQKYDMKRVPSCELTILQTLVNLAAICRYLLSECTYTNNNL
jgi:hypothetical protein